MRELGLFLKGIQGSRRNLCFVIREQYREFEATQVMITPDIIDGMIQNYTFKMSVISITVSNRLASSELFLEFNPSEMYSISGFPRVLHQQESRTSMSSSLFLLGGSLITPTSQVTALSSVVAPVGGLAEPEAKKSARLGLLPPRIKHYIEQTRSPGTHNRTTLLAIPTSRLWSKSKSSLRTGRARQNWRPCPILYRSWLIPQCMRSTS